MSSQSASRRVLSALLASVIVVAGSAATVSFAQPAGDPAKQPEAGKPQRQPEGGRPEGRGPGGPGGGEIRSIETAMKVINGSLRKLSKQLDQSDKKDENLTLVSAAERAAIAAKGMKPENSPAGSGPDAIKAYRAAQITLSRMLLDLEEQVLNDKTEDAKKTMAKLGEFKDESHKKFAPPEDEDKPKAKREGGPEKREGAPEKK